MQHIAKVVKKDPIQVRLNNMRSDDNVMPQMVEDLKVSSDYDARKESIDEFNQASRFFLFCYTRTIYEAMCCIGCYNHFLPNLSQFIIQNHPVIQQFVVHLVYMKIWGRRDRS
jgi:hypothetical protein